MSSSVQQFGGDGNARSWLRAAERGLRKKCPQCGRGALFLRYSKTAPACPHCGLDLTGHRADDAPPYVTILVVGHLSIPLALATKQLFDPPLWAQFAVWGPVIMAATFWFLPRAKGALIGLQWANRMHGFSGPDADPGVDV